MFGRRLLSTMPQRVSKGALCLLVAFETVRLGMDLWTSLNLVHSDRGPAEFIALAAALNASAKEHKLIPLAYADQLAQLADFGSCDVRSFALVQSRAHHLQISDALIKLKVCSRLTPVCRRLTRQIPHGGLLPDITMLSPSPSKQDDVKIMGEAYTVKMVPTSDTEAPKLSHHFVRPQSASFATMYENGTGR